MNLKKVVHQKIEEILEPFIHEKVLSPSLKEKIEKSLLPLDSVVDPISPYGPVVVFYRLPTDKKGTYRRVEVKIIR